MRGLLLILVISMIAAAQGQYHPWSTVTDNWGYGIDDSADYETLSVLVPITGYDVDDFEAYGGKGSSLPIQTFSAPSHSKMQNLNPLLETLPETYANPIYTEPVVMTQLIDQPIKMPKVIRQPIIQQRVVEQPIVRTRVINQPIIRRIVTQPVVRPMITKSTSTKPMYSEQQVVQPKIYEQNIIRQSYSEKQQQNQPIVQAATHTTKGGFSGYGNVGNPGGYGERYSGNLGNLGNPEGFGERYGGGNPGNVGGGEFSTMAWYY